MLRDDNSPWPTSTPGRSVGSAGLGQQTATMVDGYRWMGDGWMEGRWVDGTMMDVAMGVDAFAKVWLMMTDTWTLRCMFDESLLDVIVLRFSMGSAWRD